MFKIKAVGYGNQMWILKAIFKYGFKWRDSENQRFKFWRGRPVWFYCENKVLFFSLYERADCLEIPRSMLEGFLKRESK